MILAVIDTHVTRIDVVSRLCSDHRRTIRLVPNGDVSPHHLRALNCSLRASCNRYCCVPSSSRWLNALGQSRRYTNCTAVRVYESAGYDGPVTRYGSEEGRGYKERLVKLVSAARSHASIAHSA